MSKFASDAGRKGKEGQELPSINASGKQMPAPAIERVPRLIGHEDRDQVADEAPLTTDEFQAGYGEPLARTLDLDTWQAGADLVEMYARLEQEVGEAVRKETEYQRKIRREIFPRLRTRKEAPPEAGLYTVDIAKLEDVHRQILFNGALEACDGTVVSHDTLPVTIIQIGVCLVSYRGDQGSWVHRLYRRDLRTTSGRQSPVDEVWELLERRRQRGAVDQPSTRDRLTDLGRRGIMAYAERAVLLDRSQARWRMGHGNPTPWELVAGSGMTELVRASLTLLRRLVLDHRRFVFVPSAPTARELLSLGNALHPLEYAIVDTNRAFLERTSRGGFRGESWGQLGKAVVSFAEECGPKIVVGLYRASELSPAQMFYAHVDHAHEAALIALADSVLQEHRGFPLLIDLADRLCSASFGGDTFAAATQVAYATAGEPFRYLAERRSRR